MKKLLLSALCCLPVAISANAQIDPQAIARHLEAQVEQAATPQALNTVDKIMGLFSNEEAKVRYIAMAKNHAKESCGFFVEMLRSALNKQERAEFIELLDEICDWYAQMATLGMDTDRLRTPAGQEAYMQLQMQPLLTLQKPLAAAIAKRALEFANGTSRYGTVVNNAREGFISLWHETYDSFKEELTK